MCECFNEYILEARIKGIVTTNEMIRTQLMIRIQRIRDAMKKITSTHCPRIIKKIEQLKEKSFLYTTTWSGGAQYQVLEPDGQYVVDKGAGTCSCRRWQLSGIPCSHGISVIYYNSERPETYIDSCYKVSTYMDTYRHTLNPTHDRDSWPKSNQGPIIPPQPVNRKIGRKTVLRRRELGEERRGYTNGRVSKQRGRIKCSICGAKRHNKRFHGKARCQGRSEAGVSQNAGQTEEGHTDPIDNIDSQVLDEHFNMGLSCRE